MNSEIVHLWYTQTFLQSVVAVLLWRRGLYKRFPVFFAYVVSLIAIFAMTYPILRLGNYEWYFWVFWSGAAISAILGFKVIHEIFIDVFRPYQQLKDLGTVVFKWAFVVMLLVSVVVAFSDSHRGPVVHAVRTLENSVRFVQFGLILFLMLFSRFLGVSRRQLSFGIALGFGLFAGMELMFLALVFGGYLTQDGFNVANMAVYNLSIVIWIGYCGLARSEVRQSASNPLQTHRWEQGLADIQHPVPSDSLIPMFESMVERAISRSSDLDELPRREPPVPAPKTFSAASSASGSKLRG